MEKLVNSTKKVKSSCLIHRDGFGSVEKLVNFYEHSWEIVKRQDYEITEIINSNLFHNYFYHKSCYCTYTHSKTLKSIETKCMDKLFTVEIVKEETAQKKCFYLQIRWAFKF